MIRIQRAILSVFAFCLFCSSASAYPMFLQAFQKDPFRRLDRDGCATCHVDPNGGGPRNPFGQAFERGGEVITPILRAQFPDRFAYPTAQSGATTIHFSDPANKQMVVETGGTRILVDMMAMAVDGHPASPAAVPTTAGPGSAASATKAAVATPAGSDTLIDSNAHEGAFFGMQVVNLPNGKTLKPKEVDFQLGHRFSQPISDAGLGGLFGFDSAATVDYGVHIGITNHVSVGYQRSNLFKTNEFNAMLHVVRQGGSSPLTFAVRAGVEGRNNFKVRKSGTLIRPRMVSSFVQPVVTHTIAKRVSLTLVPTFAFNTQDEQTFTPPELIFGSAHNNTIALGIGAGVRVLPTTSIVGEYIPRVWGFKGELKDRPGVSMALEKSTFRHTFALIVARQTPMTAAQYAVQGTDTFQIGFSIFRKIR